MALVCPVFELGDIIKKIYLSFKDAAMTTTLELLQKYSVAGPRYTSYPTAPYFHTGFAEADWVEALAAPAPDRGLSLYAHIPFCDSLCYY